MGGVQNREFGQDQIVFSLSGRLYQISYCKLMKAEPEYDTGIYFLLFGFPASLFHNVVRQRRLCPRLEVVS